MTKKAFALTDLALLGAPLVGGVIGSKTSDEGHKTRDTVIGALGAGIGGAGGYAAANLGGLDDRLFGKLKDYQAKQDLRKAWLNLHRANMKDPEFRNMGGLQAFRDSALERKELREAIRNASKTTKFLARHPKLTGLMQAATTLAPIAAGAGALGAAGLYGTRALADK